MGFNLQQYNLVNSSWDYSNADGLDPYSYASGRLCGWIINDDKRAECEKARDARKGVNTSSTSASNNISIDTPLTAGAFCAGGTPVYIGGTNFLLSKEKRERNRTVCRLRKEAKRPDDNIPANAKDESGNSVAPNERVAVSSTSDSTSGSKVGLYVGIGVGVLVLTTVAIILIKRSRK